jgi:quercetin dioxygenase-like cupin family protein
MRMKKSPKINALGRTSKFKLAKISAKAGTEIPTHSSKEEVMILVQNGRAVLTFNSGVAVLEKNNCRVIPAFQLHAIKISEDFEALAIMGNDVFLDFLMPTEFSGEVIPLA